MKQLFLFIALWASFYISKGQSDTSYSFFVAGHTYGTPGVNNIGLHPPFKAKFPYIQSRPEIELGILTGDIVSGSPTSQDWDEVDVDIANLGLPVHFSVGNHDMENRPIFEGRYGSTYYDFTLHNDLFIILDPNIHQWNILGDQLLFLENTLKNKTPSGNIYVFFHQILWRNHDNQFNYINWNSSSGRSSTINFWSDVIPLLKCKSKNVYFFAGDVGVSWASKITYDKINNLTFIASGMGGEDGENFIVINVDSAKNLTYDVICLSDTNENCLGELKDYAHINHNSPFPHYAVYPNPARSIFFIDLPNKSNGQYIIYNNLGEIIKHETFSNTKTVAIPTSKLNNGFYQIKFFDGNEWSLMKVIVDH